MKKTVFALALALLAGAAHAADIRLDYSSPEAEAATLAKIEALPESEKTKFTQAVVVIVVRDYTTIQPFEDAFRAVMPELSKLGADGITRLAQRKIDGMTYDEVIERAASLK